jgi:hypothetical protein
MDLVMGEPNAESYNIKKRLISIIRKQKNLGVSLLRVVNPLEETTPALILQNDFFYQKH